MNKGQLLAAYLGKVYEDANNDPQKMLETLSQHYNDDTLEIELKNFAEVQAQKATNLINRAENDMNARLEQLAKEKTDLEAIAVELSKESVEPVTK